jgi:hypothetical protein
MPNIPDDSGSGKDDPAAQKPEDADQDKIEVLRLIRPALSASERQERELLIAAMQRLDLPDESVNGFRKTLLEPLVNRAYIFLPKKHKLPPLRSDQSLEEWKREADEYLRKEVRDKELGIALQVTGWDAPPIAGLAIKRRGQGGKGRNVSTEKRYEAAALRLLVVLEWHNLSWNDIARRYRPCESERELDAAVSAVKKAAKQILRRAGIDQARRPLGT